MVKSKRDRIRDAAEYLLKETGKPLHNSSIAEKVLPELGIAGGVSPKDVNTCLHDDPLQRFVRVGKGTWMLKDVR
jgi:hypothetical protein